MTFVLPAAGAAGGGGEAAAGLVPAVTAAAPGAVRGLLAPASLERPRASAGDCGEVGGGTAGTLGDGLSDLASSRRRRRRATNTATSAASARHGPQSSVFLVRIPIENTHSLPLPPPQVYVTKQVMKRSTRCHGNWTNLGRTTTQTCRRNPFTHALAL